MGMNWPNNETGNDSEKPKSEGYLTCSTHTFIVGGGSEFEICLG
jgi:hypothetical protein